jgi:hypothetical protein
VHGNAKEAFLTGFDGYPFATLDAFHSCEDSMKIMFFASSVPKLNVSSLQASNAMMPNLN